MYKRQGSLYPVRRAEGGLYAAPDVDAPPDITGAFYVGLLKEMCIRDRSCKDLGLPSQLEPLAPKAPPVAETGAAPAQEAPHEG